MNEQEREQLTRLYKSLQPKMLSYALKFLNDPDLAQDVVQDTFCEAVRYATRLLVHPNPEGWLMQALKFKLMESQRTRNRYLLRFLSLDSAEHQLTAIRDNDTPETIYIRTGEAMGTIKAALTPEDYHLLCRIVLDQVSHKTVAHELGISIAASQKRLSRIRRRLMPLFPERQRGIQSLLARFKSLWHWGGHT